MHFRRELLVVESGIAGCFLALQILRETPCVCADLNKLLLFFVAQMLNQQFHRGRIWVTSQRVDSSWMFISGVEMVLLECSDTVRCAPCKPCSVLFFPLFRLQWNCVVP